MKIVRVSFFQTSKRSLLLAFSAFFAMAISGFAGEPTAQMVVSRKHLEVGQTARLRIVVSGEGDVKAPHEIDVDGLQIQYQGRSTSSSFSFNGSSMSRSQNITDTFALTPQREGEITIPAQHIEVDGKSLTTNSVTLDVAVAGGSGSGSNTSSAAGGQNAQAANSRIAFAELIVPQEHLYVGETMPVVVNIFFDMTQAMDVHLGELTLKSDGFTAKPFGKGEQQQISKNGKSYVEVSFKTAITPVKTGVLTLGGAELQFQAMVPQQPSQNDDDDDDDDSPFNGNAMMRQMMRNFNSMSMMMGSQQVMTVRSAAVKLDVKPLPDDGRPADFSGAVGQFKMVDESASPASVNIGDPVNVKIGISGYGNFDRIGSPEMMAISGSAGASGWKSYPSSGKFVANDDLGISGTKTFDISIVPLEKQTRVPEFSFSYFDPTAKKYVTLRSREFPLVVSGSAVSATAPIVANSQPTPAPSAPKRDELLPIKTGEAKWGAMFAYWMERPIFWKVQAVPLLALLLFGFARYRKLRAADVNVQRAAAERRERDSLTANLQSAQTAAAFYSAAVRLLQFDAGVSLRKSAMAVSDNEVLSARVISAETQAAVQRIWRRNDELSYTGSGAREQALEVAERHDVLQTVKAYEGAKTNV